MTSRSQPASSPSSKAKRKPFTITFWSFTRCTRISSSFFPGRSSASHLSRKVCPKAEPLDEFFSLSFAPTPSVEPLFAQGKLI
eukprot:Skav226517  [mRNA]  locus=scaffold1773:140009:141205:+ [translate_table: standard]